jgi:hypothetical protein
MAMKKLVNKARQALLVPVLMPKAKKSVVLRRLGIGESITLDEAAFSPQLEMFILRKQIKVYDAPVAPPASVTRTSKKLED